MESGDRCSGRNIGEEGAEAKGEALDLMVRLRSYPHLCSQTLGHD